MKPLKWIDDWLNGFTMYRAVSYGLLLLAGATILLSATGTLGYDIGPLVGSLFLLAGLCYVLNIILAKLYRLPANLESSVITGLILFFIMLPPVDKADWLALVVAAVAAMASKYIFTWRHASIFNPAAAGAVVVSLTELGSPGWWVASKPLFIFVLLIGLLVIRKVRRFSMFFCFAVPAVLLNLYWLTNNGDTLTAAFQTAIMSYPIVFLGAFMLTEPSSMPQTNGKRLVFAAIIGVLFASRIHIGDITMTPHLSLIIGNLFAFAVSRRAAVTLKLLKRTELAPNIHDFAFASESPLKFEAGQYMEWTVPGVKLDMRGNRRTFTIASSPHEKELHLGMKTFEPSSTFKTKLMQLKPGDTIEGSHVAGDFLLPHATSQKLVFIAGGIGVTPFRAMAAEMIIKKQNRDAVLYYSAATDAEIVYDDIWTAAAPFGLKLYTLTGTTRLTSERLAEQVPDFKQRQFYISGPPPMVRAYKQLLKDSGIPAHKIHTDYFSGY